MPSGRDEISFKVLAFPSKFYSFLRRHGKRAETTNRELLRAAVDAELGDLEDQLAQLGFAPPEGARKLVRTAFDTATLDKLRSAAERTGVDASTLVLACLRRHLGVRLVDPDHKKVVAIRDHRPSQKARKPRRK